MSVVFTKHYQAFDLPLFTIFPSSKIFNWISTDFQSMSVCFTKNYLSFDLPIFNFVPSSKYLKLNIDPKGFKMSFVTNCWENAAAKLRYLPCRLVLQKNLSGFDFFVGLYQSFGSEMMLTKARPPWETGSGSGSNYEP